MGPSRKNISHTGTRTRVFRGLCIRKEVKAGYPNQLDYMGLICQFPFSKFNENSSREVFVFNWWFLAGGLLLVCAVLGCVLRGHVSVLFGWLNIFPFPVAVKKICIFTQSKTQDRTQLTNHFENEQERSGPTIQDCVNCLPYHFFTAAVVVVSCSISRFPPFR